MTKAPRSSTVISARVSSDTKASFAALATRHRLSESSLLAKMVHEVIQSNGPTALEPNAQQATGDSEGALTRRTASRCDFALGIECLWKNGPMRGT